MTKGKFGLSPTAVAVIAFGFCALRQPQSVLLVAGFALLAEKDEWLNRQALQALLLAIAYYLAELVTGWICGGLAWLFGWVSLYSAAGAMGTVSSIVGGILYLALIVFSVLAVLRVLRGQDAGIPLIRKITGGEFMASFASNAGPITEPVQMQSVPVTPSPAEPAAVPVQMQSEPAATPPPQDQPASAATADLPGPESVVQRCRVCSAPLQEGTRFCTACGAEVERN